MVILNEQDVDGVRVVRVSGSLTQQGVETIEPAFMAALPDGSRAVVDLAGVDMITTPGLTLIISTTKRLRRTSGRVVFTAARDDVMKLLHRCRLDEILDIEEDKDEALARVKD